jgi:hypothetical protein
LPTDNADLGIISTTSAHRRDVVEMLIDAADVEYILFEKVLFQQAAAYDAVQGLLHEHNIRGWVNCPRRNQDVYQQIKQEITGKPIDVEVTGNSWALASNGIHFADLFSWLTESAEMVWDRSSLEDNIIQNKRDGFKEIRGRLTATNGGSNTLTLRCFDGPPTNPTVRISTPNHQWTVWEDQEFLVNRSFTAENTVSLEQSDIELKYQSELTGGVADEIFQRGDCRLPDFGESCQYHLPYLETIREHINEVGSEDWDICPIT